MDRIDSGMQSITELPRVLAVTCRLPVQHIVKKNAAKEGVLPVSAHPTP
jgi:hypothetical protein